MKHENLETVETLKGFGTEVIKHTYKLQEDCQIISPSILGFVLIEYMVYNQSKILPPAL